MASLIVMMYSSNCQRPENTTALNLIRINHYLYIASLNDVFMAKKLD